MEQKYSGSRRNPAAIEEEKVWASFYRNVSDPGLATELIAHMDKDADSRMRHPGLYLRCRQSLRRHRERQARARRYGNAVRAILRFALGMPAAAIARFVCVLLTSARFGGDVALNLLGDEASASPYVARTSATRHTASAAKRMAPASNPLAENDESATSCTPDQAAKSA